MFLRSIILLATVTTAHAETPMGPAEFDAYTTGRTLFFARDGQSYGAERYLPGRRVQWSFLDGQCKDGRWYPEGDHICFVYEDDPDPHCWQFTRSPQGLKAQFQDDGQSAPLYEALETDEEMLCLGPEVGV